MGSRGPFSKPGEQRQGHGKLVKVVVPTEKVVVRPPKPSKLLKSTDEAWERFWESDVAAVVTPSTWPAVSRYFTYLDELQRAVKVLRDGHRLVEGSRGQVRLNPLADYMNRLEEKVGRLETELGLTPMARARLGIAVGQARLTAAEVNAMASTDVERPVEIEEVNDDGWEPA